jgi:hypothetical protein
MANRTKEQVDPDADAFVLLDQVAARIQRDAGQLRESLNGQAQRDWTGRWVVSAAVAREIVEGYDADRDRLVRLRAEFGDYEAGFNSARHQFMQDVFQAAYAAVARVAEKRSRAEGVYADSDHTSHRIASRGPDVRAAAKVSLERLLAEWNAANKGVDLVEFTRREGNVPAPSFNLKDAKKRAESIGIDAYMNVVRSGRI